MSEQVTREQVQTNTGGHTSRPTCQRIHDSTSGAIPEFADRAATKERPEYDRGSATGADPIRRAGGADTAGGGAADTAGCPEVVRQAVRERDGYRCVRCAVTHEDCRRRYGRGLHVHRLTPGSQYTLDGCESLCPQCHVVAHGGQPGPDSRRRSIPLRVQTRPSAFRISAEVLEWLDAIAADRSKRTGLTVTRTDVVRLLVREECARLVAGR